jgi:hypothetical protein
MGGATPASAPLTQPAVESPSTAAVLRRDRPGTDRSRRDEAEAEPRAGPGASAAARGEGHAGQTGQAAGGGGESGREQARLRHLLCP